jgi:hypothetical protein
MFNQVANTAIVFEYDQDGAAKRLQAKIVERTESGALNMIRITASQGDDSACEISIMSMGQMGVIQGRKPCQELVQWLLPLNTNLVNWSNEDEKKIKRIYEVLKV